MICFSLVSFPSGYSTVTEIGEKVTLYERKVWKWMGNRMAVAY